MEKVLYRCYLKFIKNENKEMWKKLNKIPIKFWIGFLVIIIAAIFSIMNLYVNWFSDSISGVLQALSLILCVPWYIWVESYIVDIADESLQSYLHRCKKIKDWLKEHDVDTKAKTEIIIRRINKEVEKRKQKKEKIIEKIVGVIQVLIIPIILLIVSNYGKEEQDFEIGLARIVTTLFIFSIFFICFFVIANTINIFRNNEIAKLEIFSSDLQGVLDLELFEKESGQAKEKNKTISKKKSSKNNK